MKASGLVRHFLISPFPKSENWKQQKSTSSASALARRYELSMVAQHCGEVQPWWMGLTAPNPGPPPPPRHHLGPGDTNGSAPALSTARDTAAPMLWGTGVAGVQRAHPNAAECRGTPRACLQGQGGG